MGIVPPPGWAWSLSPVQIGHALALIERAGENNLEPRPTRRPEVVIHPGALCRDLVGNPFWIKDRRFLRQRQAPTRRDRALRPIGLSEEEWTESNLRKALPFFKLPLTQTMP
jgi:hypothetical protein